MQDGQLITAPRATVLLGEGMGQTLEPLAQQAVDSPRIQGVVNICRVWGLSQRRTPLSRASKAMPRLRNWHLAYSLPFRHSLALYGKYVQNLRQNGPKSLSSVRPETPRV